MIHGNQMPFIIRFRSYISETAHKYAVMISGTVISTILTPSTLILPKWIFEKNKMNAFVPSSSFRMRSNPAPLSSKTTFLSTRQFHTMPKSRSSITQRYETTANLDDSLAVMVNGVPGKMAAATAEEVVRRGLVLADEALTGPSIPDSLYDTGLGSAPVRLSTPDDHVACLQRMRNKYPNLIVVDYTHPTAANPNVEKYSDAGLSFVIGTTGGDTQAMHKAVESASGVYAVIAPNMGKQIVAFQAMMEMMAKEFPGAFSGYDMYVKESHQSTKADTSGTAKAVVESFTKLGLDFSIGEIEKVREVSRSEQEMNVPREHIKTGHAFHTYHLTSPDGSVNFEFQHNVCGRAVYAAGTVDAAQFLANRRQQGGPKRVFNMIDILRSGTMS